MIPPFLHRLGMSYAQRLRHGIVEQAHKDWLNPSDPDDYAEEIGWRTGQGDDWCGIWAGAVAVRAGLHPDIARIVMPSTYRLATNQDGEPGWSMVDQQPPEPVPVADVQPGDICSITTSRGLAWGDHIVIISDVLVDTVITYEGNTRAGIIADTLEAPIRRSVCRCERKMQGIVSVYRFTGHHGMGL